jgi:hypothetical protein
LPQAFNAKNFEVEKKALATGMFVTSGERQWAGET